MIETGRNQILSAHCFIIPILLISFVSIVSSLPGPCVNETQCGEFGACTNSSNASEHTCVCTSPDYIGETCNEEFSVAVNVSNAVPTKGDMVTFGLTLKSPANGQVNLKFPNETTMNLTAMIGYQRIYDIASVGYEYVGIYEFEVSIMYEKQSHTATANAAIEYVLTVNVSVQSSQVYFETGQNSMLSVTVSIEGNLTNVNLTVMKKNGMLERNATLEPQSTDLRGNVEFEYAFDNVSVRDNGTYVIEATETYNGQMRKDSAQITVAVEVPASKPTVNSTDEFAVKKGTESRLLCLPEQGQPEPNVSWSHDREEVSRSKMERVYQTAEGYLVFTVKASYEDNGYYTCTATNVLHSGERKNASTSINITIEGSPEVVSFSPMTVLQGDVQTFSCEFDAYPRPSITWTWKGDAVSLYSLFNETTDRDDLVYYKTKSRLEIPHSALCLGNSTIKCKASNVEGQVEKDFRINNDPYAIYMESYVIFPNENSDFSNASNVCNKLGGSLVDIRSAEEQRDVTRLAEENGFTEFYVGLRYRNNQWEWTDNSPLRYFDNGPLRYFDNGPSPTPVPDATNCVTNRKTNSAWAWHIVDCTDAKQVACKVKASKFPSNLTVSADKCDGQLLNVTWTADRILNQSVELHRGNELERVLNELSNLISSEMYSDLQFGTEYRVKVSSGVGICSLLPRVEATFTTAYQQAETPDITVNTSNCDFSWTYPIQRLAEITGFQLTVTEQSVDDNNNETLRIIHEGLTTGDEFNIPTTPNSKYGIRILTLSCIGNSDPVEKSCVTDPEAMKPLTVNATTANSDMSTGIEIRLPMYSERNGPIRCVYVVARWTKSDTNFEDFNVDAETFNAIIQGSGEVTEGSDYFAFALNNQAQHLTLGVGGEMTECPNSDTRRKRQVVRSQAVRALNRPLETDSVYRFYVLVAVELNGDFLLANGGWSNDIRISAAPQTVPLAAIVVPVIVVVLLLVIIALLLISRKRRGKENQREQPIQQTPQTTNAHINQAFSENIYERVRDDTSIAVENLRPTYLSKHADEDRLFREEYRALAMEVSELSVHFNYGMAQEVRDKNRFSNIHPANESRVVLRREGNEIYSDYINASYLDGYRHPRKFIASQGPLQNTIGDFWYMVWEQESTVIVMLTRVDEGGRRKCEKYWPDDQQECSFDGLLVRSLSSVQYGPIIKRTFQLSNSNLSEKVIKVEQFHYVTWPDHGVPITTSALFNLRRMVIECQGNNPSPIIVHCSAGVGRTGTFIAMDYLINQMSRERRVDVYGVVFNMRRKRKEMVQTVEQYAFLHKLMLEQHLFGVTDKRTSEFFSQDQYEMQFHTDSFANLSLVPPFKSACELSDGVEGKSRDEDIMPYLHSKVIIRMRPSEERSRFINASYVQTYSTSESFIACQGPVLSGVEDFWRVVLDNNVTSVIMLSKLHENGKELSSQYWPDEYESPLQFGDITATLQSQSKGNGFTERWIQVSEKVLHLRRSLNVMQLHYEDWAEDSVPADAAAILSMIARSQASRKTGLGKSPVLVHCRNGSGKTGTFCTIVNLIERLKNEDRVDIFRTVKDLRDMRPLMVATAEQYRFCIQALKEYLDSFQLYANFQ